jgi:ectoine hydroxylase-related dioxygenase (phytanoyl-CoA dioxygenase family)
MTLTAEPVRPVTADEIDAYRADGAVLLTGIMPMAWVDLVRTGIEEIHENPGDSADFFGEGNQSFLANMNGPRNEKIWRYISQSPAASIAAAVHAADRMSYFKDQLFYKAAGPVNASAWHQDTSYLNVTGSDLVRVWLPCDPAPRETAIEVVAGSHAWGITYRIAAVPTDNTVRTSGGGFSVQDLRVDEAAPPLPDINAHRDEYRILGWDVEPGDALVFHGSILHGAGSSAYQPKPRRVLAVLYAGPRERYVQRPGRSSVDIASFRGTQLNDGELLSDHPEVYPLVWSA